MGKISKIILLFLTAILASAIAIAFGYSRDYSDVIDFMGIPLIGLMAGFGLLVLVAFLVVLIFWVWMLIDCLKRDFKKDIEKLIWVVVIIFLHFLGAFIYYFVVKIPSTGSMGKKKK